MPQATHFEKFTKRQKSFKIILVVVIVVVVVIVIVIGSDSPASGGAYCNVSSVACRCVHEVM